MEFLRETLPPLRNSAKQRYPRPGTNKKGCPFETAH
jgi:hypothetical protein